MRTHARIPSFKRHLRSVPCVRHSPWAFRVKGNIVGQLAVFGEGGARLLAKDRFARFRLKLIRNLLAIVYTRPSNRGIKADPFASYFSWEAGPMGPRTSWWLAKAASKMLLLSCALIFESEIAGTNQAERRRDNVE